MFTILAYTVNAGAGDANVDETAVVDANFSRRNSHYILSEPYNLIAAMHHAASATRARLNVPTINGIARHQIWPVSRSADIPSDCRVQDFRDYPMPLPMNEEIAVEESNDLAMGNERTFTYLWIAPPSWNRNLPRGEMHLNVRFTGTHAVTDNAWGAEFALTFAENLKGGVYVVVGCEVVLADGLAFRLNFPRAKLYQNRKLLPGDLCRDVNTEDPKIYGMEWLGEWGRFHTFEPPQMSILSLNGGGTAVEGRMHLIYLGQNAAY